LFSGESVVTTTPGTTAVEDRFYEGRWAASDPTRGSLRNWLVKKERFFLRWLRGRSGRLLDLGCGGGWAWLASGRVAVGVDVSWTSLRAAARLYRGAVQARWDALPFRDGSFDTVFSSDVLGHVPLDEKDAVWAELRRILRPGGLTLHYVEADSADPLMRLAKRSPDLYARHVVAPEGHIGMETPAATLARFRRCGFEPVDEQAVYRLLMYLPRATLLFDNEYRQRSQALDLLARIAGLLQRTRLTTLAGNVALSALMEVADRVLPASWANGVLVAYRKPSATSATAPSHPVE
ncbi:MAG: class I SAM-dependent methyltransferase, partial [Chloroflexi bacterium]|nr:class I SAM-dependent methyltransferase [Chloroflexota bacterium]